MAKAFCGSVQLEKAMRRITKLTELVAPVNPRNFQRFEGAEVELEACDDVISMSSNSRFK